MHDLFAIPSYSLYVSKLILIRCVSLMAMQEFKPLYEVLQFGSAEQMVAAYDRTVDNRRKRKAAASRAAKAAEERSFQSGVHWIHVSDLPCSPSCHSAIPPHV